MTFFQRFKTPFADNAADEQMRSQPRVRLIGEYLQERREDLGLDLDEIGAMLRIKPAYLSALEQGHSHDLPGPTYAIGFIRAYADFLGLDAEQVLARFKAEAAGVTARPDLALPVPLGERSLPGGALVLVVLIVTLCGYGIWYYLSTEERDRPQRVAAVPANLQTPPAAPAPVSPPVGGVISAATVSPPSPTSPSAPAPGAVPPAPPPLFGATTGTAPAAVTPSAAPTPAPSAQSAPAAMPPASAAPPAITPPAVAPPAAPIGGAPRVATITAPAAPTRSAGAPAQPPAAQPPATQPLTAGPAPATAPATPPPVGTAPTAQRIAIRALSDCWIQVRAADQSIVFSRVLKTGEVYKVPARSGLSLRTGNAGALEIAVDGKTAPSIGGVGTLRRDVALDPAALAAGTAVHG